MLHDVDDVEMFCAHVARMFYSRTQTRLSATDNEDLVQYLLVECWRLSGKYTPTTAKASFRSYAYSQLSFRCVDFLRLHRGRTSWKWKSHEYHRERLEPLRLDAPYGDGDDSLGSSLTSRSGDGETDSVCETILHYTPKSTCTRLMISGSYRQTLLESLRDELRALEH